MASPAKQQTEGPPWGVDGTRAGKVADRNALEDGDRIEKTPRGQSPDVGRYRGRFAHPAFNAPARASRASDAFAVASLIRCPGLVFASTARKYDAASFIEQSTVYDVQARTDCSAT